MNNALLFCLIFIEYISFFSVIFRFQIRKDNKYILLSAIFIIAGIIIAIKTDQFILAYLFAPAGIYLLLEINIVEMFKSSFIAFPAMSLLESAFLFFSKFLFGNSESISRVLSLVGCIVVIWLFYLITRRKLESNSLRCTGSSWIVIGFEMILLSIILTLFMYILTRYNTTLEGKLLLSIMPIGCISLFVLNFVMLYFLNVKKENEYQIYILSEQNIYQKEYFEKLLSLEEQTRRFRHDLNANLYELLSIAKTTGDIKRIQDYLNEMLGELAAGQMFFRSGNDIVDAMLNYYLVPVSDKCKINVSGVLPSKMSVDDMDLCVIFSNILKNAVEATERIDNPWIDVSFMHNSMFIVVNMKNNFFNENFMFTRIGNTHKSDYRNHGFGLRNVEQSLHKFGGEIELSSDENIFTTKILIPLK